MTTDEKSQPRLAVNIGPVTKAAIDQIIQHEGGITQKEAVARLIRYGDFAYQTAQIDNNEIWISRGDTLVRIVFI